MVNTLVADILFFLEKSWKDSGSTKQPCQSTLYLSWPSTYMKILFVWTATGEFILILGGSHIFGGRHSTYLGNKYGFGIFVQLTWLILKSLGKNGKAELKNVKWQTNSCKWQLVHPSCHNCTGSISKELAFQANNSNLVKWIMWTDLL